MCTGIKINYPGGHVLGRTMDLEAPVDYNILYLPKDYPVAENLLGGYHHSQYKMLGVGFRNMDPLKDGVNEHGLIGITNDFGGFGLYDDQVDQSKTNVSAFYFMNYILANCRDIDEVLKILPTIHISSRDLKGNKVITPIFHFMFSDSKQNCIVVEPNKKKLKVYQNPYGIMTNAPKFSSHVKLLETTFDKENLDRFNGAKNLPGGYDPKSRFLKAYYLAQQTLDNHNSNSAFGNLYRVLSAVALPKGFIPNQKYHSYTYTVYLSAYDSQSKRLTIQAAENPMVYSMSFDDIQNQSARQVIYISQQFSYQNIK
ncbi:linear amide C-N hydrolase [Facklamia miroungae]|uniref:Choloylglycine hydrolase n=1 Tax=Facklamia miroungae TaxID=120956 RepID=A0A1G7QHQ2_9LACT|nr:linear amide C-N hydrolase [Facklamia miroungae]NKZ28947.1 linear amide C-N hydrolase [Facklamia miroungae]SDF98097.1 choloylglycine hydrolase [Facklamia miroungae]